MEKQNYDEAIEVFSINLDYKDNRQQIKECNYLKALLLIEEAEYAEALAILELEPNYKDSAEQIKECSYQIALAHYEYGEYLEAYTIFTKLEGYKETLAYLEKTSYGLAKKYAREGKLDEAISLLEAYPQSEETAADIALYNNLKKVQGTWITISTEFHYTIRITGSTMEIVNHRSNYDGTSRIIKIEKSEIEDRNTKEGMKRVATLSSSSSYYDFKPYPYIEFEYQEEYKPFSIYLHALVSDTLICNRNREDSVKPYNPTIGMTAEEVEKSTWGEPDDINKTTTVNSIQEQWCYPDYKYIYFTNGVVTSIQE